MGISRWIGATIIALACGTSAFAQTRVVYVADFATMLTSHPNDGTIFRVTGKPLPDTVLPTIICTTNGSPVIPGGTYPTLQVVMHRPHTTNPTERLDIAVISGGDALKPGMDLAVNPDFLAICDQDGDGRFDYVLGEATVNER